MNKKDPRFEQFETLLKLASTQHKRMNKIVGVPIPGELSEKVSLYITYPLDKCIKHKMPVGLGHYWDIPRYTNGSTRHAQCLFLLPCEAVHDGAYPYSVRDTSEIEQRYLDTPGYDREKVLIEEVFDDINHIQVVWSFDYAVPDGRGTWFYHIEKFWFGIKKNGILITKESSIEKLININL